MTSILKTALFAAVGAVALASAAPAFAASPATDAFVANVHPNVDFLDNASRLALKTSTSTKLRAFARTEATDQTLAGNQLVAWTQTQTPGGIVAATGTPVVAVPVAAVPVIGEPVAAVATVPLDVASGVTDGVGDVLTGRSVAIDALLVAAPLTVTRTPAPGTLLPSQETDMERLSTMSGKRFDAFYVTTQKDALRQLVTLYTDYQTNGDDPALRAMAARQLPIVRQRLEQLRGM